MVVGLNRGGGGVDFARAALKMCFVLVTYIVICCYRYKAVYIIIISFNFLSISLSLSDEYALFGI